MVSDIKAWRQHEIFPIPIVINFILLFRPFQVDGSLEPESCARPDQGPIILSVYHQPF